VLMIVAIDIGGSKIRVGYSHVGDHLEDTLDIATPVNQRVAVQKITDAIHRLIGATAVDSIGIACPGPINKQRGTIVAPRTIPWHNLRLVKPLERSFHCPVLIEHDATAAGIAEARIGAGQKYPVVLYITLSTGVGSSIIVNGAPLPGPYNSEAGRQIVDASTKELFHDTSSGVAIELRHNKKPYEITNATTWQIIASDFAIGIYNAITIVQPSVVVLGGGVAVHFKQFIKPLQAELNRLNPAYPLPPIKQARYAETAPAIGVMLLAAENL
jgi:mannose-6-phosphate isomerase